MNDWLIWSVEHKAWWRKCEFGYTKKRAEAGTYTQERAEEICRRANNYCGDTPYETMVRR